MTPEQLAALVADKEAGTPGPWYAESGHVQQNGQLYWQVTDGSDAIMQNQFCWCQGSQDANARRIARVPDLEDAVIALQAEVARLSTPPDDAEVADLAERLRDTAEMHREDADEAGEYGKIMAEELAKEALDAADYLTSLSHALAAERAKREAMEAELRTVETDLAEAEDKFHIASFYIIDDQTRQCVMDRVMWMAKAGRRARATLATHGSK